MISVVIATYNGRRFLKEQLQSIAEQTMPPQEVIICDDGSSDGTVELCKQFIEENSLDGWRVEVNSENMGYCRNFYSGLEKASGDYIFFCDQDDVWYKEKIEVMVLTMQKNQGLLMLCSRYKLINAQGVEQQDLTVPHFTPLFDGTLQKITVEQLIGHSFVRGCSLCMKKELKSAVLPIDLKDLLGHDWQIAMLAALKGGAAVLNTALMGYRCHDSNISFSATPVRRIEKRISGVRQSIEGHEYILSLCENAVQKRKISKFISFEKRRLRYLETKNIFLWLALVLFIKQYSRYYGGNALRVWIGDFLYR